MEKLEKGRVNHHRTEGGLRGGIIYINTLSWREKLMQCEKEEPEAPKEGVGEWCGKR